MQDFSTRYPNLLESCIMTHFQNGNKRIALVVTFLHDYGKWLTIGTQDLYNFAVWVAQSPAGAKEHVVAAILQFFKKHLTGVV